MTNTTSTWGKLRWPFKAILIAVPIILLTYFANKFGWLDKLNNTPSTSTTINDNSSNNNSGSSTTDNNSGKSNNSDNSNTSTKVKGENRTFSYNPEKPVNGTLKGIVEVGATGFNSFVINVDKEKRWEIIKKDFGKSFVYEGLANAQDIRAGLKTYIGGIMDKGVVSRNVHFVISSGAQKVPATAGIVSELKKMGYVVNLVTAEQEGKLALKSVLPKAYFDNSFVVDIGSGNTKISYPSGDAIIASEAAGAKYYEKGTTDADVYAQVKAVAAKIPSNKREVCFIIGGVPFELANQHRSGEERFTVLHEPNDYSAGDKKKVACGLNIYKALKDATGCDTFVFDWDANFSIGFLLGLN